MADVYNNTSKLWRPQQVENTMEGGEGAINISKCSLKRNPAQSQEPVILTGGTMVKGTVYM